MRNLIHGAANIEEDIISLIKTPVKYFGFDQHISSERLTDKRLIVQWHNNDDDNATHQLQYGWILKKI